MALDLQGNIVSIIQVIALILLIIGVYPYRIRTKNRNLIIHGFLSILALALNLATTISVMIPSFSTNISFIIGLSILQSTIVWLHVATGIGAIILGFVIIVSWVTHPLGELGCAKTWRLMMPTFLIWALALILGLIIHIFGIV
jgi:hypothetical protein